MRDEDNFVGQVLYAAACSLVTGRDEHLKEFRVPSSRKIVLSLAFEVTEGGWLVASCV